MKPHLDGFAVVTASTSLARARECRDSWETHATYQWASYTILNGEREGSPYLGVVPAFAQGVDTALRNGAQIIACLHDDLLIEEAGWDSRIDKWFRTHPQCGLLGFGGGVGLGDADIYQTTYSPHQWARQGFVSNMRDAEQHGVRCTQAVRVACLDGFSQVGTRAFWQGESRTPHGQITSSGNLFQQLADLGVVHHCFDSALGCYAKRLGWDVWMLPILCHHYGGRTAVGDPGYQTWAETIVPGGDRSFWEMSHAICYEAFRDVMPIRI